MMQYWKLTPKSNVSRVKADCSKSQLELFNLISCSIKTFFMDRVKSTFIGFNAISKKSHLVKQQRITSQNFFYINTIFD